MIHPAALIESGDWSKADPETALAAGKRHGLQMKVLHAALEYALAEERAIKALECRLKHRFALLQACDELLKLVPVDKRPHPSARKARRA